LITEKGVVVASYLHCAIFAFLDIAVCA